MEKFTIATTGKFCKKLKNGDFVFLDPPYVEEHEYQFNYNKGELLDQNFLNELQGDTSPIALEVTAWLKGEYLVGPECLTD